MRLAEDDFLRFAIDSTPRPDASFKRTADTFRQFWTSAQHLVEDGDSTDAGSSLKQRDDLSLEYWLQGVRAAASSRHFALRWLLHLLVEAVCSDSADRRF